MRRLAIVLGIGVVISLPLGRSLLASQDVKLRESVLATSFGGAPTLNGKCCIADPNCTIQTDSCANHNNDKPGCNGATQITLQANYAPKCTVPDPANPNADCTDYPKDLNNRAYLCIAVFFCSYDGITGICSKGGAKLVACVTGTYSCASNCPLPPP